jgi:hypothetical protein
MWFLPGGCLKHSFHQVVQKCPDARRAWFDRLTMTVYKACPERVEGRAKSNAADGRIVKPGAAFSGKE